MNVGDEVVLTETVLVIDGTARSFLAAGNEGTVVRTDGNLLGVRTANGVYDSIPAASVRLKNGCDQ